MLKFLSVACVLWQSCLTQHTGPDLSCGLEACSVPSTGLSGSTESSRLQMMLLSQGANFNPGGTFTWLDMT